MLAKLKNSARKNPLSLTLLLALGTITFGVTASQQVLAQTALSSAVTITPDVGGQPVTAYLPNTVSYNSAIPTPESVFGANIGEWHVRHDQVVNYMQLLAEKSDRITIEETGRTHENRPLLLMTITAPSNRNNIEAMRQQHIDAMKSGQKLGRDAPLIFYMGYSIHGNEPSGTNASLALAYYLAAAEGEEIDALLNNNIVLFDPSFNPDGLSRFAQWANMHKGKQLVSDSRHREHDEGWPSGRTNHYWFDLNRDWLLLAHPESQARIKQFHKWRPHILTDFHEMGTDSTYFFQPGVRSRKNPLTPDENVTLTEALAQYHAAAFDEQGELYFTQEAFDDFYAGKGSTYPDLHGSVGILFEQASSRGHLQNSINGKLAFKDTIANQITTSLSTFRGALANKAAILDYQSGFVKSTQSLVKNDAQAGYVVSASNDTARFNAFVGLLEQHHIQYEVLSKDFEARKVRYGAGKAVYIPLNQPQYRLVKSIFSTQTSFENNTFYDVSTWNLALAFNLDYAPLDKGDARSLKLSDSTALVQAPLNDIHSDAYAYAFSWQHYYAPAMLQTLLEAGVKVRSSEEAFSAIKYDGKNVELQPGSIVVPKGLGQPENLATILRDAQQQLQVPVFSLRSGLTPTGHDLGSRSMAPVTLPQVLIVGGEGTSEYEVGEMWHYFDTKVGLPASIVEQQHLLRALSDPSINYTHVLFPSGRYSFTESDRAKIEDWVKAGGVIVGQKSALRYFAQHKWLDVEIVSRESIDNAFDESDLSYKDGASLYARKLVAGAVFEANIDNTHPLFYGYDDDTLPMFKTNNMIVEASSSPFITPARYTDEPLMAGFSDNAMVALMAESTAVTTQKTGRGVVIGFTDNTQFRGYWYGTNKMLANAIYQSHFIR
ncbi:peptidase M14 [Alteromonas portus]|uniref:Peptidase M14 n=1 Tax=Alteromonas portus TaxID=2565549 RepID=A0A4U0ZFH5_9ALTE|nr:M14 family zinc carboxypeptidase [Alteromonas portus]TKB02655.1 peptidase M14 [Alteromonas portus]